MKKETGSITAERSKDRIYVDRIPLKGRKPNTKEVMTSVPLPVSEVLVMAGIASEKMNLTVDGKAVELQTKLEPGTLLVVDERPAGS